MREFYCTEDGTVYTEDEIRSYYEEDPNEHETFADYLDCCLDRYGGTMIEITKVPKEKNFVRYEAGEGYIFSTREEGIAWTVKEYGEYFEYWSTTAEEVFRENYTEIERK